MNEDNPGLITDETWPESIADMRSGFAGSLNVYRMMAHNPALLKAWETLRNHVVIDSALTPAQSETVILRTGWHWRSCYEWTHHVYRGRKVGMSDAAIARCAAPAPANPDDVEGLLILAVDHLMDAGKLPPALRDDLATRLGLPAVFDVMATVGMYTNLAFIIETFNVPIDGDVALSADDPLHFDAINTQKKDSEIK